MRHLPCILGQVARVERLRFGTWLEWEGGRSTTIRFTESMGVT